MFTPRRNRAFLSVAGEDVTAARRLASAFTPNLIYLYEQSGQHAADLWAEESAALRDSSVVVIFWSKNYLKKKGTLREIALIAELLDKRALGHPLIVRLDDTNLLAVAESLGDPMHGKPVLAPLTERWRTLPFPYEPHQVEHSLEQLLVDNGLGTPPDHDRSTLIQSLTQAASISLRQIRPVVWISGHEGYGRRFLIDRFMRTFDPNSRRLEIPLSDADGPLQALFRVLSSGLRATEAELAAVAKRAPAAYGGRAEITQLTECVKTITTSGQHLVFRLEPVHNDASGWIPKWMADWFSELPTTSRPLVFVAAQFAYPAGLLNGPPGASKIASFAVPSLTFEEAKSYAVRLTSCFDMFPDRWTEPDIDGVADASAGTIALLISIARERCQLADLRLAPPPLLSDDHPFTQRLNAHLNICVDILKQTPDALELLATLIDLVLVSYDDLCTLFPRAELPTVLGRCLELGLVESPADGQYQVPRLVHRRLYSYVLGVQGLTTESVTRAKRVLRLVADQHQPIEGGDVFQKIETRIRSSLAVSGEVPEGRFEAFVSASYLFHAAIRAYDRQRYDQALKLLRLCIRSIEQFPELNTKCVVFRYYGLAAARQGEESDKLLAVDLLRKAAPVPRPRGLRVNPVSDADFVLGFADRLVERWEDAIRHFRSSLTRLEEEGNWRVADCHRELADCFLHTRPPQYADARFHAQRAYESRDNFMSLDIYVKSLVQSCWNDTSLTDRQKGEIETKLETLYARLETTSTALGNGVWHLRKAEDIAESGEEADLIEAVAHVRKAIELSRREDFHPLLWKLLLRLGTKDELQECNERTEKAASNDHFNKRTRSVAARYLVAAHVAGGDIEAGRRVFDRFRNGFPRSVSEELRNAIQQRSLDGTEFAYRR